MVHRDIKPLNVLLDKKSKVSPKAVIADLGISFKLRGPFDKSQWRIGSDGFIAPEVSFGDPYRTDCDVFSLGCILHWLLTGKCPFWDENVKLRSQALMEKQLDLKDEKLYGVTDTCKDLMRKMLMKNPSERINIKGVIEHRWLKGYEP